jgi:hypothetical protein
MGMTGRSRLVAAASGLLLLVLAAAGCGENGDDSGEPRAAPSSGDRLHLSDVCPDPIVVQEPWQPQSEQGVLYQLLGAGYTIDTEKKRVSGPLEARGADTGVKIEIRSGGPAVGMQRPPIVMYLDKSIHLAMAATDTAVEFAGSGQPTTAVVAPLELSPGAVMWDPQQYPQFKTIADIGRTDTRVLHSKNFISFEYLVDAGILKRSQLDASYTGAPDLFVAYGGKAAQQGFATSEPYLYEHEIKQWGKPLRFQLLNDTGYVNYANPLVVRSGDKAALAPCLRKLVPILQQAQIDFVEQPEKAIKIIVEAAQRYQTGWRYSENLARYSATAMLDLGVVGNGADQTLGNFDMNRLQRMIDIIEPVLERQRRPVPKDLKPEDIATNEFIDPSISLAAKGR